MGAQLRKSMSFVKKIMKTALDSVIKHIVLEVFITPLLSIDIIQIIGKLFERFLLD